MNLFVWLLNATVVLCLIIFDYYAFHRVSDTIKIINEISLLLDVQGRERYIVQKHYTDWLVLDAPKKELEATFKKHQLFDRKFVDKSFRFISNQWSKTNLLKDKRNALDQLKLNFAKILVKDQSDIDKELNIQQWTNMMIDLLDELQQHDLQLSNHLSQNLQQSLKNIVIVNVSILTSLVFLTLIILYYSQQGHLRRRQLINGELLQRQNELKDSKKSLFSLMEDLTEEKNVATNVSTQLQNANEEMQLKNEEMEQFIYTVSHDLKSPLVTIGGFTKKLLQELQGHLTDKQQHRLQRILDNVNHMETLLTDLLQLSAVIRQELEMSDVNIEAVVAQQCNVLENFINETGTKVSIHSPLHSIVGNERLISQCVFNLFTNAIKYREVTRPLIIDVWSKQYDQFIYLTIKDNGVGMEQKYHQKIFRIFERLGYGEGTGVGLTIVKTIMEKQGGKIQVASELGVGSEFTLVFPLRSNKETAL